MSRTKANQCDIDIIIIDERWKLIIKNPSAFCRFMIKKAFKHIDSTIKNPSLTIVLANDNFIKDLNYTYRSQNKPTNVLSFYSGELVEEKGKKITVLGDIVLSFETIKGESLTQGKDFTNHLKHIMLHGLLHLLGYDHKKLKDRKKMEKKEIEILLKENISNPYL